MDRITKVVAYITRDNPTGERELLVFEHRDFPEAGVQVPAGTVKDGEKPEDAVMREVAEEIGLENCHLVKKLAVYAPAALMPNPESGWINERHVFHLAAPPDTGLRKAGVGWRRMEAEFPSLKDMSSNFAGFP
jgi:8-oxo-dGTP diphosphatase